MAISLIELSNERCRRCHRRLKDETSKKLGFGKICYAKYLENNKNYLFEIPIKKEEK